MFKWPSAHELEPPASRETRMRAIITKSRFLVGTALSRPKNQSFPNSRFAPPPFRRSEQLQVVDSHVVLATPEPSQAGKARAKNLNGASPSFHSIVRATDQRE